MKIAIIALLSLTIADMTQAKFAAPAAFKAIKQVSLNLGQSFKGAAASAPSGIHNFFKKANSINLSNSFSNSPYNGLLNQGSQYQAAG